MFFQVAVPEKKAKKLPVKADSSSEEDDSEEEVEVKKPKVVNILIQPCCMLVSS